MAGSTPLLETVRGLLERTYRIQSGLGELAPFVIGDQGYRRLYAGKQVRRKVAAREWRGAQLLIRQSGPSTLACIYYPDELIQRLESRPPQHGIDETNVDAFSVFVEEIDHLLLLAERTAQARPLSLFEMELHATVSKYLVLSRFVAGRSGKLDPGRRVWLRYHLFERGRYREECAELRRRYRDALRWGVKFVDALPGRKAAERIDVLRRFHDAGTREKLRLIDAAA